MDKAMEALKPCPFCGSEAVRVDTYDVQPDDYYGGTVKCSNCDAEGADAISLDGWLASKDDAEASARVAWNTRATPDPVAPPSPDIAGLVRGLEDAAVALLTLGGKDYSDSVKAIDEAAAALQRGDEGLEMAARHCEDKASRHGWNYHLPSVGRELAHDIRALKGTKP